MKNILFACDLDNTLIYSFKHKKEGDICVEWLDGKEQSFMTPKTYQAIGELRRKTIFLPLTTRSLEQYRRIKWPEGAQPEYAITTNGSILLVEDGKDEAWGKASNEAVAPFIKHLEDLKVQLTKKENHIRFRIVDEMYLFAYCEGDLDIEAKVEDYKKLTDIEVVASGRKIYFFPPQANKGLGVENFKKLLKIDRVISAGDSVIDLPMLEIADLALVPNQLAKQLNNTNVKICPEGITFGEFIVDTIESLE